MDDDEEIRKFKRLLGGVAVFLMIGWFAIEEIRYTLFGSIADATVVESFETTHSGRRGRQSPVIAVRYSFQDGESTRSERDDVPVDWTPPGSDSLQPGSKVSVQYLAGVEDKSRLAGHTRPLPLIIFSIAVIALAGFAIWLWRHASAQVHGPRRRH